METFGRPVLVIGIRRREIHGKYACKLEPRERLLVLPHHMLNVVVVEPGVGLLLPRRGAFGAEILRTEAVFDVFLQG